jgi:hypothetical protein
MLRAHPEIERAFLFVHKQKFFGGFPHSRHNTLNQIM